MQGAFTLKLFHPDELPAILKLLQETGGECPGIEEWKRRYFLNTCFVLRNEEKKLVGWCAICNPHENLPYKWGIPEIWLKEVCRNQGILRLLLKRLIFTAQEQGFSVLRTTLPKSRTADIEVYQKQFFRIVGEEADFVHLEHH